MKTKLLLLLAVVMTAFSVNAQINSVAVVGIGVGGWPGQDMNTGPTDLHQMTQQAGNPDVWEISGLVANGGECKFRANNIWTNDLFIWGTSSPTGTISASGMATQPGNNFGILPGTYTITLNVVTGEYTFSGGAPISIVNLVGTAVPGGTIAMMPSTSTVGVYTLPLTTFLAGTANFEVDGVLISGGNTFPSGDTSSGTAINVTAGAYTSVTYNNDLGTYLFVAAPLYPRIGLIGSGTTGTEAGWNQDIAMATNDGIKYQLNQQLYSINTTSTPTPNAPAKVKFRQDQNWGIPSFGGDTFTATNNVGTGGDIPVTADGIYNVFFNRDTKVYNFVKEGSISLLGDAVGGWNDSAGNPGPVDINQMTTTDGENYSLSNVVVSEGICKFRTDNNWSLPNFAGAGFPSGNADNTVSNITVPSGQAGTYNVTFNKITKDYTFTNVTFATASFSTAGFKVYPNPSNSSWNFSSTKEAIVSVQVYDMLGKVVATSATANVDASALKTGVYFAKVNTANASASVKVVRN